jgi:hypothetical protein
LRFNINDERFFEGNEVKEPMMSLESSWYGHRALMVETDGPRWYLPRFLTMHLLKG